MLVLAAGVAEGLLTFSLPVPEGRLTGSERINGFYRELLDRVQAVPGVLSASVSTTMPVRGATVGFGIRLSTNYGRATCERMTKAQQPQSRCRPT